MTTRTRIAILSLPGCLVASFALAQDAPSTARMKTLPGIRVRTVVKQGNQEAREEVKQGNQEARETIREGNAAAAEAAKAGDTAGARQAIKESRRDAKQTRREAHQAAQETREAVHDEAQAIRDAAGIPPNETPEQRAERHRLARLARWGVLQVRLGTAPIPPPLTAELLLHARRVAFLTRIRLLALEAHETAVQTRVDTLLARETVRHETQVSLLAIPMPGIPAVPGISAVPGVPAIPGVVVPTPGISGAIGMTVLPGSPVTAVPATAGGAQ